jgi:3-oxoacyl-[acyl-carrier-protein] synthase-3
MTIITELREKVTQPTKLLCCGFGVGLSWGTVALTVDNLVISELVNVNDNQTDQNHVI